MSISFGLSNNDGNGGCGFLAAYRRAYGSSLWAWSKGRWPSGTVLHSSCEPAVCSCICGRSSASTGGCWLLITLVHACCWLLTCQEWNRVLSTAQQERMKLGRQLETHDLLQG